jgi:tetratricopeptide (TPR) repeat protein
LTFAILGPLGLYALVVALRRGTPGARFLAWAALAVTCSLLPFGIYGRYRLPLIACLLPGAAWGALELARVGRAWWRARTPEAARAFLWVVGPLLFASLLVNLPLLDADLDTYLARDHYGVALLANRRDDRELALAHANRAVALDEALAAAHLERGVALAHLGRTPEALEAYRAAAERREDVAGLAHFNAALLHERLGRPERARAHYKEAILRLGWNPPAQARAQRRLLALPKPRHP